MKKHVYGRQFKRDANERKALFKGLINSLVIHERIETTHQKAKSIQGQAEKLVTKAKKRKSEVRQFLQPVLTNAAIEKVLSDLSVRFADRPGGYTRVIKLGRRLSDGASMAIIEWVEKPVQTEIVTSDVSTPKVEIAEVIDEVKTEEDKKASAKRVRKTSKTAAKTKEVTV